ncbi:MAG: hypothetical protein FJY77_02965 [Candidatus Altiarchaeales archaeon]|nr:hypothetical protein [Candidatus Altiarchaeales archaeon]
MADKKKEEIPAFAEGLLALLQAYGRMEKPAAVRELNVSSETFDGWVDTLAKDGWIKVTDREIEEYYLELTEKSVEKIRELKDLKKKEALGSEEKVRKNVDLKTLLRALKNKITNLILSIKSNIIDISLVLSFLAIVWLIRTFISDPNQRIMNFVASIILFSTLLFVYRSSKEKLKAKTVFELFVEFIQILKTNVKFIVFSILIILLIYFTGWMVFYPEYRVVSTLLCTVVLTSIIQLYRPLTTGPKILQFYVGMLVTVYSMMLIVGIASITSIIIQSKSRPVDVAFGIAILALIYVNRDFFGVQIARFKKALAQGDSQ